jgi:hypothetical protein
LRVSCDLIANPLIGLAHGFIGEQIQVFHANTSLAPGPRIPVRRMPL